MAWEKSGSRTATGATNGQTLTGLGTNTFVNCFGHTISGVGNNQVELQFGYDGQETSGYVFKQNKNGTEGSASINTSVFKLHHTSSQQDKFFVSFICNPSGEEKLFIGFCIDSGGNSVNQPPNRTVDDGKQILTSNQINQIKSQSENQQSGTNFTVLSDRPINAQDGAIYYDKILNKEYVLYNNTWTEV